MHDRFKFRLWDVQNQKYLYFDLFDSESLGDFAFFASEEAPDYNEQIKCPDTNCWALKLEQCTGLKDKNGKLIYENDIIKVEDAYCPVVWDKENARYNVVGYGEIAYLNYNEIEVCGNIHENADLLGEK